MVVTSCLYIFLWGLKRMHTHANAMSAAHTDIRLFWCNVRDQSLADMQLFLKRFPDTVALWRDAAHLHQFGQVVYANTGMNSIIIKEIFATHAA